MRLLITGISGQLGSEIAARCNDNHEVFGTYLSHRVDGENNFCLDLSDRSRTLSFLERIKPGCIIHCAAASRVEFCESERDVAWKSNVAAVKNIADFCAQNRSKLVFISSEYVFGGRESGLYREDDIPNPVNFYGKTKLAAEILVRSVPGHLIVRTSVVFSKKPGNLVHSLLQQLRQGRVLALKETNSPAYAPELASAILQSLEKNLEGTYHMAGATPISRHELAKKLAQAFELDAIIIPAARDELNLIAPHPENTSLDISRAQGVGLSFSSIDRAIAKLKNDLKNMEET